MVAMAERRIKNGMRDGWGLRVTSVAMLVGAGLAGWWQGPIDAPEPEPTEQTRETKAKDVDAAK